MLWKPNNQLIRVVFIALISVMSWSTFAAGQTLSYAAKFICGIRDKESGGALIRGLYGTVINIHNPHAVAVRFRKKAVLARPQRVSRGRISPLVKESLLPDQALGMDCRDIGTLLDVSGVFIEGFVVLYVDLQETTPQRFVAPELDVVGVYTARPRGTADIATIDVEPVKPITILASATARPDLLPIPTNQFFCRRADGNLVVTVKNQGEGAAAMSSTRVQFGDFGSQAMGTSALAPGASVELFFPIPFGCYNPDCNFTITVDETNVVPEVNEGNNSAADFCLG